MHFHITSAFSQVREQYRAAKDGYSTFDDTGEDHREREAAAWGQLDAADTLFWNVDAYTPFEISEKLEAARDRAQEAFSLTDFYSLDAMRADLARLRRDAVSPDFADYWSTWRKVADRIEAEGLGADSGILDKTLEDLRSDLYVELVMKRCTTPGDFILKRYLSLLTTQGPCDSKALREAGTANPWAIDTSDFHNECRHDSADLIGSYDDIDSTDLGANLLAYGLVDFDAQAWMEAADRVGQRVDLVQQQDGSWATYFSMVYPEENSEPYARVEERIRRQRDRLLRINAFGGLNRHRLIADEIRKNWPQLIVPHPLAPESKIGALDELVEQQGAAA